MNLWISMSAFIIWLFLTVSRKIITTWKSLTRVGYIPKKSHEGHLGVFFDPQNEIFITSALLRICQPNFTGVLHIWSGI